MEVAAVIVGDGVHFSRHIMRNHSHIPATLTVLAISPSSILPVDSSSSLRATVRSDPFRPPAAVPRALVRRIRRIRRRSSTEGGDEDGFFDGGDGDDGPFGGGNGGGKGWDSWRPGGSEWEDPDRRLWYSLSEDPAFDVIYEVLCWIALSNCAHFAFKKMSQLLAERWKDLSIRSVLPFC
ncbi:uncharacterized protein LOC110026746 [Phalaenopsis equestris]|uniref:uncharacterized protein LOC110026746 n=1 Tax=Phalaenopsis equestris TaxID=78828 RepID=UPI0009E57AAE|nr:uncharacterized protein LOC110026746 [Phalaenopsis equestris]